ncbi:MAG: MoaD/ThiS family protein [Gemmatimonadota bacterium]
MPMVTVRYWAAAKQAAGVAEEEVQAETLSGALTAVVARRQPEPGAGLQAVLDRSSFLIDGDPAGGRAPETVALPEAAVIEVLPPFAGG